MDAEALELSARNKNIRQLADGSFHPSDIMAHKIQQHIEEENSKVLTMFNAGDKRGDQMFKHLMTLQGYGHSFEELINKAKEYRS